MKCSNCKKTATHWCAGCKRNTYCGKSCQAQDWNRHIENCVPFLIEGKKRTKEEEEEKEKEKKKEEEEKKREEIERYIDNLQYNHRAALESLIGANFFGEKYRVANGDLMWHLIHQSEWPRRQGIDDRAMKRILDTMKDNARNGIFTEDNLQYVVNLAQAGVFGDVEKVIHPNEERMPVYLQRPRNWLRDGIVGNKKRYDVSK